MLNYDHHCEADVATLRAATAEGRVDYLNSTVRMTRIYCMSTIRRGVAETVDLDPCLVI